MLNIHTHSEVLEHSNAGIDGQGDGPAEGGNATLMDAHRRETHRMSVPLFRSPSSFQPLRKSTFGENHLSLVIGSLAQRESVLCQMDIAVSHGNVTAFYTTTNSVPEMSSGLDGGEIRGTDFRDSVPIRE